MFQTYYMSWGYEEEIPCEQSKHEIEDKDKWVKYADVKCIESELNRLRAEVERLTGDNKQLRECIYRAQEQGGEFNE